VVLKGGRDDSLAILYFSIAILELTLNLMRGVSLLRSILGALTNVS
jgi:hypothetical protein